MTKKTSDEITKKEKEEKKGRQVVIL